MTIIDPRVFTERQKIDFIHGWMDAGGYMADVDAGAPEPWCCPWEYLAEGIEVVDRDYYAAGRAYWTEVKPEVLDLIKDTAAEGDSHDNS